MYISRSKYLRVKQIRVPLGGNRMLFGGSRMWDLRTVSTLMYRSVITESAGIPVPKGGFEVVKECGAINF